MKNAVFSQPALVALAFFVAISQWACGPQRSPETHEVTIDSTSYSPSTLEARVGDTIVWTNRDLLVHTVTAGAGGLDSKDIRPGESWRYTPTDRGELAYLCVYHSSMKGTLRVR